MSLDGRLVLVKTIATRSWYETVRDRYPTALVPDWRAGRTETGEPVLTVQVIGQYAQEALHRFAADYPLTLGGPGDQRPGFEYRPGRVVCVYRRNGVWIEMWHRDTPTLPAPTPAVMPKRLGGLFPSGRLPFRRRDPVTVIKEN
ncbi:hypothetical protein [Streptomyces sp. NPDC059783]|uniref:hypothetical protein n=1 Tax=Streptomyces sp. NPDC059783 TaxID=3346944 RepID=UPI00365C7885